ncbi:GTPase domain-containing protein [Mycobacterium sp. P7213]|uniref:GTPase domain-containing protein n=1 Tax=Mycobacterium sp. P7213 TaxID=2478465 RepID=UPI000F628B83|nr:GTPase domain-containing protein [Mycobacterium sp. P7213]
MSERIDVEAAKMWLDAVPGGEIGATFEQRWQRLAAIDEPVVTLYGSYDTGKSSLLRRLLIESGQAVPSWLTVSARHETFEANEIRAAGCVLRDTPGFVPEGSDARSEQNSAIASEAIAATDVAIITVPPQLATAEFPVLRELIKQDWIPGSLWVVISRFDEAGVEPDEDLDGYRALGERKALELRTALDLDETVPVHVVCQDFAQMAGAERNPNPAVWDDSREWDGIVGLLAAVRDLGASPFGHLRDAAAQRFWRRAVQQTLSQLNEELATHLDNIVVSDEGEQRRTSWLAQLDTLSRAAEAGLRGRLSAAIGDAVDRLDSEQRFPEALKASIGAWYDACERDIDKLLHNVSESIASARARPDWQQFETLAATLRREPIAPDDSQPDAIIYANAVREVGDAVLNALRYFEQDRGLKQPAPTAAATGGTQGANRIAAATAGVKLVADLAGIAAQYVNRQRTAEAAAVQRKNLQSALDDAGDQAKGLALDALTRLTDDARQRIMDATAGPAELRDSLHRLVDQLRDLITSGEALLVS